MGDNDEIILIGEKRQIEQQRYNIWPGDEKHELERNDYFILVKPSQPKFSDNNDQRPRFEYKQNPKKRERSDDEENKIDVYDHQIKRPVTNRYFSSANLKIITNSTKLEDSKQQTKESDQFLQRRDFILNKLLQSRTLPDPENNENSGFKTLQKESKIMENSKTQETILEKPKIFKSTRKHDFQDDFIPLFKTEIDKTECVDFEPKNRQNQLPNPSISPSYRGSYSRRCLSRVRQNLIDSLYTSYGSYTDRAGEIAKMKINIKSKFDGDQKLWRRIKRDTALARQVVLDRLEYHKKFEQKISQKPKHIQFVELDDESTNSSAISISSNEEKVIKMINEQETCINLNMETTHSSDEYNDDESNSNDVSSDNSDIDSKCSQFGKYSKINNEINKKNLAKNNVKFSRKNSEKKIDRASSNSSRLTITNPTKNNENNYKLNDDELENLKLEYKRLRNLRNKAVRSIKKDKRDGADKSLILEVERETMNAEMTKIRRTIKKLNRKNKSSRIKSSKSNSKNKSNSNSKLNSNSSNNSIIVKNNDKKRKKELTNIAISSGIKQKNSNKKNKKLKKNVNNINTNNKINKNFNADNLKQNFMKKKRNKSKKNTKNSNIIRL